MIHKEHLMEAAIQMTNVNVKKVILNQDVTNVWRDSMVFPIVNLVIASTLENHILKFVT